MAEEKMIKVRNRNAGSTGYDLENGQHRKFEFNETKIVPLSELRALSFTPGGEYILKNCLVVEDKSALEALNLEVEPEYFYSEAEIKEILLNGSYDQLEDTLNFAPDGVIEIIKKLAVSLEIPDVNKREMISKKTGFNINNAIMVNKVMAEDQTEEAKDDAPKRKTQPIVTEAAAPVRKTTSYKIVEKK